MERPYFEGADRVGCQILARFLLGVRLHLLLTRNWENRDKQARRRIDSYSGSPLQFWPNGWLRPRLEMGPPTEWFIICPGDFGRWT